jgi:hypothetical protein
MQGQLPDFPAAACPLNIVAAALLLCCLQVQMNTESLLLKEKKDKAPNVKLPAFPAAAPLLFFGCCPASCRSR